MQSQTREEVTNSLGLRLYRRGRSIGIMAIAVIMFLAYALLFPHKGLSLLDTTLPCQPLFPGMSIFSMMIILAGTALLVHLWPDRIVSIAGLMLLAYSVIIVARVALAATQQTQTVATNLAFCYFCFLVSYWLGKEAHSYKRFFPIALIIIFACYGIVSCVDILTHPFAGYRLMAIFRHPNHLGNVLAFAVVFCFAVAAEAKIYRSLLLWLTLSLLLIALVHTVSRGAYLGCLVGISCSLIYLRRTTSPRKIYLSLLLLIVMSMLALLGASPKHIAERFSADSPNIRYSVGNRVILWRYTLINIRKNWLFGVGITRLGQTLKNDPNVRFRNNGSFSTAMNNYLTLAIEAGVPALALYLTCIIYLCFTATTIIKSNEAMVGINTGLLCGVYSMLVFALSTYTLSRIYATVLLWSALGYIVSQGPSKHNTRSGRSGS